MLLIIVES